jgi:hypothetical protein
MNASAQRTIHRIELASLVVAVAGVLAAAIVGFHSPAALLAGCRIALFLCLGPSLGSLIFVLIHRMTGGQWAVSLAPFLSSGVRLLPWVWLLVIPLLFTSQPLQAGTPLARETRASAVGAANSRPPAKTDAGVAMYFSRPLLAARAVVYGLAFFFLTLATRPKSDGTARVWVGPVGLIVLVFLLHLLVTDWIAPLEPDWHSTGFPLVWMTGQALSGLAVAVCAAALISPQAASPRADRRGIDQGNLLLASVMSWMYVAFVQFLIVWSGNLPAEIRWYLHRAEGLWRVLLIALALLAFALPFFALLSRQTKRRNLRLAAVALLLFGGQCVYTIWMIGPAMALNGGHAIAATAIAIGLSAIVLNRYLAGARALSFSP